MFNGRIFVFFAGPASANAGGRINPRRIMRQYGTCLKGKWTSVGDFGVKRQALKIFFLYQSLGLHLGPSLGEGPTRTDISFSETVRIRSRANVKI